MDIKVGEFVVNPDGSGTVQIELDEEALKAMATYGIMQSIENSLAEIEWKNMMESVRKNPIEVPGLEEALDADRTS